MSEMARLLLYACAVTGGAMAGALVPIFRPPKQRENTVFLGFASGVMLGAAFFHMLPEAVEGAGFWAFPFLVGGLLALFLLERYVLVHACEEPEAGCEVHGTGSHSHDHGDAVGLPTFIALSAHTLIDGLALGVSIGPGLGTTVFVALILHKIPSSISLASILLQEKYTRAQTLGMNLFFSSMVPMGALLYLLIRDAVDMKSLAPRALAFSAGTFLHLSFADLLPQVHRKKDQRLAGSVALLVGVGFMLLFRLLGAS